MDKDLPISAWPEWEIIEKIGEGSFGKVYKARRMENDLFFYSAIKIITIPFSNGEYEQIQLETEDESITRKYFRNIVDECIQEVITMENFRGNSFIVSVEDFKVIEHTEGIGWDIFIRMELLENFTEYCAGKNIVESDVIKLGIDLCKAMEYCEKINIIHRDIKPENIFVSRFGDFKLGDFGIAKKAAKTISGSSRIGTDLYMAPEIYRGESYDMRADIYSIGLVLYKLMNKNRLPFLNVEKQFLTRKDKEIALNKRMSGEKIPVPCESDERFAKVILKACEYSAENRYENASFLRKDLEYILQTREEYRNNLKEESKEKAKKPRDPIVTMLGVSVVIIAIAICVLSGIYIKLLVENDVDRRTEKMLDLIEEQRYAIMHEERENFSRMIEEIDDKVIEIANRQKNYTTQGENGKKVLYYDGERLVKVLIYPKVSADNVYEEYYYWDGQLIFAHVWHDNIVDMYYYENGNLIRWIDEENICHDQEERNEEYVIRGDKYWSNAVGYNSN